MKVIFCLPGEYYSGTFLSCWTFLTEQCRQSGIEFELRQNYSSMVHYARNNCLEGNVLFGIDQIPFQGATEYDYIMWIDSDIVFSPSDFFALNHHISDIGALEEVDKKFSFLTNKTLAGRKVPFKVDYTGMGWMLIERGVLESLAYPWFYSTVKTYSIENKLIADFISEDVQFCEDTRKAGYDIWINPQVIVGHEKVRII